MRVNGAILRTIDGGTNWTEQTTSWTDAEFFGVDFTGELTGTTVGRGVILNTTDGGATWSNANPLGAVLYDVSFANPLIGTAVGENGAIRRTTNGGTSWMAQTSWTATILSGVAMLDELTAIVVGGGVILRTTDGGTTWITMTGYSAGDVSFADASNGIAAGSTSILRTSDAGLTWTVQSIGDPDVFLSGVSFTDIMHATVVGGTLPSGEGTIFRTTDGGVSWNSQVSGTSSHLNAVVFVDSLIGVTVGDYGTILRTTNGGVTWVTQSSGTSRSLKDVFFSDAWTGTAVGDDGIILRTTSGGTTWIPEDPTFHPEEFLFRQNYPNPFNPSTTIEYLLPHSTYLRLEIFNVLGESVAILAEGIQSAGFHRATFDAGRLGSGIYFYRLQTSDFVETKKMLLVK